jgi:hypothetical protein
MGKKAAYMLPTIRVDRLDNPPVIQVIDEGSGEIIYTVRAKSEIYTPKVYRQGLYTIRIGEPGTLKIKEFNEIRSLIPSMTDTLEISF